MQPPAPQQDTVIVDTVFALVSAVNQLHHLTLQSMEKMNHRVEQLEHTVVQLCSRIEAMPGANAVSPIEHVRRDVSAPTSPFRSLMREPPSTLSPSPNKGGGMRNDSSPLNTREGGQGQLAVSISCDPCATDDDVLRDLQRVNDELQKVRRRREIGKRCSASSSRECGSVSNLSSSQVLNSSSTWSDLTPQTVSSCSQSHGSATRNAHRELRAGVFAAPTPLTKAALTVHNASSQLENGQHSVVGNVQGDMRPSQHDRNIDSSSPMQPLERTEPYISC